jgi:hypothetical protein
MNESECTRGQYILGLRRNKGDSSDELQKRLNEYSTESHTQQGDNENHGENLSVASGRCALGTVLVAPLLFVQSNPG